MTGSDGTVFSVSYTGGTGNDIVLTVIQAAPAPEPSTWIGGALAIAGLAFTQRRRLQKVDSVQSIATRESFRQCGSAKLKSQNPSSKFQAKTFSPRMTRINANKEPEKRRFNNRRRLGSFCTMLSSVIRVN